jgi:hypothetical protein
MLPSYRVTRILTLHINWQKQRFVRLGAYLHYALTSQ